MSVMCSLSACKSAQGMCGHERFILIAALLAVGGGAAYFLL